MFDSNQREELIASLPVFSLDQCCASMAPMPIAMQIYLEFYGFFEAIKGVELEYYLGFNSFALPAFSTTKALNIATHYWQLPEPKACVFVVHGLFDHVGLFQKLIRYLLLQGYSVVAIDLPGHGLSDGERTKVSRFEDYADVLTQTLSYFKPYVGGKPCFAVGQSTGAAVVMAAVFSAKRCGDEALFQRLVFLGPLVKPRGARVGRFAYVILRRFISHIKRDFSAPNSNDSEFHHFLAYHDPLQSRRLSIEWIGAMFSWIDGFDSQPCIDTPLLILQGTKDQVVDRTFNIPVIRQHFKNTQVGYVKGAMHHLANEADPWLKVVLAGVGRFFRHPRTKR